MTIAQVVETSLTNKGLSEDYPHREDHSKQIKYISVLSSKAIQSASLFLLVIRYFLVLISSNLISHISGWKQESGWDSLLKWETTPKTSSHWDLSISSYARVFGSSKQAFFSCATVLNLEFWLTILGKSLSFPESLCILSILIPYFRLQSEIPTLYSDTFNLFKKHRYLRFEKQERRGRWDGIDN